MWVLAWFRVLLPRKQFSSSPLPPHQPPISTTPPLLEYTCCNILYLISVDEGEDVCCLQPTGRSAAAAQASAAQAAASVAGVPGAGGPGGPVPGGVGGGGGPGIGVGGPGIGAGSSARLNDAFDSIKQEFDAIVGEVENVRGQKDEVEVKLNAQISELSTIRKSLYDLEMQHNRIRQQYEEELSRLRAELNSIRNSGGSGNSNAGIAGLNSNSNPQGISSLSGGGGGGGLPPLNNSGGAGASGSGPEGMNGGGSYGGRDVQMKDVADARDRDIRDREREMGGGMRGRLGGPPPPPPPPGSGRGGEYDVGPHPGHPVLGMHPGMDPREQQQQMLLRERERERDVRERGDISMRDVRDRDRDVMMRERDMERLSDPREAKRAKKRDDPFAPSSSSGPGGPSSTPRLPPSHALYPPGPPPPGPPPGSSSGGPPPPGPPPPGGGGGPQQAQQGPSPYPPVHGPPPPPSDGPGASSSGSASARGAAPGGGFSMPPLPPGPSASASSNAAGKGVVVPAGAGGAEGQEEFSFNNVPPEFRREGTDWFAAFNPKIKKCLDIGLVHSFGHTSVVCCVQFSQDGRYLATGCNQTAQIFDTKSGVKVCELPHESEAHSGDLYIRSVRFSPDGKLLATGAEDRQIRIWDIARKRIRHIFDGHQQEIYSLDFSLDGRLIVSGSGDRTTRIWDMEHYSSKVFTITDILDPQTDAGVTSVAISPRADLVAAGSLDNLIRVWDVKSGQLVERLRGHGNSVYSVAFTPDGRGLVTGSLDKTLKLWDVSHLTGGGRGGIKGEPDASSGAGGSKDGGKDVNGNGGGPLGPSGVSSLTGTKPTGTGNGTGGSQCVLDFIGHKDYVLSSAVLQLMLQGHKNSVISLDLNSANDLLATGSGDSYARIWSLTRAP
ncbi:hypothetical protein MD484_g6278, partial [Candolleomyces efflorescens]